MPIDIPARLKEISTWLSEKKYDQVIAACNEVLTNDPGNAEAASYLTQAKALKESTPFPPPQSPASAPAMPQKPPPVVPPAAAHSAPAPEISDEKPGQGKKKLLFVSTGIVVIAVLGALAYLFFFRGNEAEQGLASLLPGSDAEAIIHIKKTPLTTQLLAAAEGSPIVPKKILQSIDELLFAGSAHGETRSFAVAVHVPQENRTAITAYLAEHPEQKTQLETQTTFADHGDALAMASKKLPDQKLDALEGKLTQNPLLAMLAKHPYDIAGAFDMAKTAAELEQTLQGMAVIQNAPPGIAAFLQQIQHMKELALWLKMEADRGDLIIDVAMKTEEAAAAVEMQLSAFLGIAQLAIPEEEKDKITVNLARDKTVLTLTATIQGLQETVENIIAKPPLPTPPAPRIPVRRRSTES